MNNTLTGNCQQCWTSTSCDGTVITEATSKRDCCADTVEGMSFGEPGSCDMCEGNLHSTIYICTRGVGMVVTKTTDAMYGHGSIQARQ